MVAAAVVGGAVVGGVASRSAAKKGAKASKHAADATVDEQRRQFDLVRQDTAPQRALGEGAVGLLSRLYGIKSGNALDATMGSDGVYQIAPQTQKSPVTHGAPDMSAFFESPDYQYNLGQTEKAINRAASAGGRYNSGRVYQELSRNASGLASGEYNNFTQRLLQMAGIGGQGIGTSANAGANAANNIGAAYQNAGNARANAYANGAAGVNNALQGGLSNYLTMQYLNSPSSGYPMANNYTGARYGNYA